MQKQKVLLLKWKRKRKTATFSMQEVIKILICGSVDDGKSTLMGKLMYDAKLILKDQFESFQLYQVHSWNNPEYNY